MNTTTKKLLILILILAASLRLYGLSRGDPLSDEVLYAFRAIGMIDFDEGADQTTPLEWFDPRSISEHCAGVQNSGNPDLPKAVMDKVCAKADLKNPNIPFWLRFSFHDHPPLVFWAQHISMKIFGESSFGFRFPSALFGIGTVYFVFLIGRLLYSSRVGLISAALLAMSLNHVFISRFGLQESQVIFFLASSSYFFLKALKNPNYFFAAGALLGLGLLSKYTAFILVPIFLTYLLIFRRDIFKGWKIWASGILMLAVISPIIIYNIGLYRAVGHFDFQLSFIFRQDHPAWQIEPGKEIGSLAERFRTYIPNLINSNSWLFLILTVSAIFAGLLAIARSPRETFQKHAFLAISLFWTFLLTLGIGLSSRFLSILGWLFALASGIFLDYLCKNFFEEKKKLATALIAIFLIFEIAYSVNSQIFYYPKGPRLWAWSEIRLDNYNWGYNALGDYIARELEGKMPEFAFDQKYTFIEAKQQNAFAKDEREKLAPYAALIIYDGNMQTAAQLWILDRLQIYNAWPVIKTETYLSFLEAGGADYFQKIGFKNFYFIQPAAGIPLKADKSKLTEIGKLFEDKLRSAGKTPIVIKNERGDEAFLVYKF